MINNRLPFLLLISALTIGCDQKDKKEGIIDGFALPEGAVIAEQHVYISNVGYKFEPLEKDGDGFISKISKDGKVEQLRFLPDKDTLHSPKGMGIIQNTLYVTDIDHLKGYDLNTKEKVFDLDLSQEGTLLLNDISVKNDSTLYMSAMDIGKIFEVNVTTRRYELVHELPRPNGLVWDSENELLYVGLFGRDENANGDKGDLGVISFKNGSANFEQLTSYQGNIDGLVLYDNKLIFTDWLAAKDKGGILQLDLTTKEITPVSSLDTDGPGDIGFDRESQKIYLPRMRENKVQIVDLKQ